MTPEEQLRARPTFAQAHLEYAAMLNDMRRALSEVVPSLQWETPQAHDHSVALCRQPFTDIEGARSGTVDSGDALGGISDQEWPVAVQALDPIARRHGFTDHASIANKTGTAAQPGTHYTVWRDRYGATVELGSKVNTVLSVYGACFLDGPHHRGSAAVAPLATEEPLPPGIYGFIADAL